MKKPKQTELYAVQQPDEIVFPLPIRGGSRIIRLLFPKDLNVEEAERIWRVLKAFADNPIAMPPGCVEVQVKDEVAPPSAPMGEKGVGDADPS